MFGSRDAPHLSVSILQGYPGCIHPFRVSLSWPLKIFSLSLGALLPSISALQLQKTQSLPG